MRFGFCDSAADDFEPVQAHHAVNCIAEFVDAACCCFDRDTLLFADSSAPAFDATS